MTSCILLSVFPILGAVACPVSSPFLWIQEELLIVWSIQFFSLLLMSANTLRGNHQMLSFFMWLTSLEDFCHLIPRYFSISSMLSTTIYVALYLDLKFFFFWQKCWYTLSYSILVGLRNPL